MSGLTIGQALVVWFAVTFYLYAALMVCLFAASILAPVVRPALERWRLDRPDPDQGFQADMRLAAIHGEALIRRERQIYEALALWQRNEDARRQRHVSQAVERLIEECGGRVPKGAE